MTSHALFDLDGDSVGRLVGAVLFRVHRWSGHADIVGLCAGLIVEVEHDAVQEVLMYRAMFARPVVYSQNADVFVLQFNFVMRASGRNWITLRNRGGAAGRT